MSVKIHSSGLSVSDMQVISDKSLLIISEAAEASKNPDVFVTSTLRPPKRQAQAMYDNLSKGKRIRYAAPGREVVALYDELDALGWNSVDIVSEMTSRIVELAEEGRLVSRHCVTEEMYAKENIIDISTRLPNPRDFVKALLKNKDTSKVITPFSSDYNDKRVLIDSAEPAVHIQILQ